MFKINNKPRTKILKTIKLDHQNILKLEKILTGRLKNRYTVKSYRLGIGWQQETSLAVSNINLDCNSNSIESLEFRSFTFVSQAVSFLNFTINYAYPTWKKRQ